MYNSDPKNLSASATGSRKLYTDSEGSSLDTSKVVLYDTQYHNAGSTTVFADGLQPLSHGRAYENNSGKRACNDRMLSKLDASFRGG